MKFKSIVCSIIAFILSTNVSAAIIDFQLLEHNDSLTNDHGYQYTEDGFQLDNLSSTNTYAFQTYGTGDYRYTGSTALYNSVGGGITQLSMVGGGVFNFLSIDLAKLGTPSGATITFIANTGHSQAFTLIGTTFAPETFNFDSGFQGITDVQWSQASPFHQFDNIVVSAVPVPAAVWLFGSGLIGLIGMARRRL